MTTNSDFRWEDQETITKLRSAYKDLTDQEFENFCTIGKTLGANPYTREIFAIKYGEKSSANIFCGRDLYQRKAQEQPDWDGMVSFAIYEADEQLEIIEGVPQRKTITPKHFSSKVIGAVATVYRKGVKFPTTVIVDFKEYYQGKYDSEGKVKTRYNKFEKKYEPMKDTVWDEKGATMIKKVAESQALRSAYLGIFKGTYDESEKWKLDSDSQLPENPPAETPKEPTKPEPKTEVTPKEENQSLPPKEEPTQQTKGNSENKETKPAKESKEAEKQKKEEEKKEKYLSQLRKRLQAGIDSKSKDNFLLVEKEWIQYKDTFVKLEIFDKGLEIISQFKEKYMETFQEEI